MHTCINVERKRAHFDISIIIKIKSNTINNSFSVVTPSLQNLLFIRFTPIIKSLNQLNPKMTPPPPPKKKQNKTRNASSFSSSPGANT